MNNLISKLFGIVPENSFKHHFRCFIYNLKQNDFRIHFKNGIFHVQIQGHDLKFYENPFHLLMRDRDYAYKYSLQPGDTVIDAGAFYGVYSVFASKKVGTSGFVYALEPDPQTLSILQRHIELNNLTNIKVINKGLWSGETELFFEPGKELGSTFILGEDNEKNIVRIPVTTIDSVLRNAEVKNNVFVKMNIEGSEIDAVRGATQSINRHNLIFSIRTNHLVEGRFTDDRVEAVLKEFNYKTETLTLVELTTFAQREIA